MNKLLADIGEPSTSMVVPASELLAGEATPPEKIQQEPRRLSDGGANYPQLVSLGC
jgi:hypothetical protein